MSNAIEIEAKALITQDEYRKIVKVFPECRRYSQTNYYIDNDERILAKEGIALRIREKNGKYVLTLKTPLSQGLLEKNESIDEEAFKAFLEKGEFPNVDEVRFLTMLDIDVSSLKILTSLTTDRVDVNYKDGLLSIDRNFYSGKTDYEIEFEYNSMDAAERILADLLREHDIPFHINKTPKVRRALKALEE
ncbi:MAG: CYTH domain-containing protein [Bacilli bacterium]|jgi:uncharacterized protein YjbK|nr:CYTH domain-containing protein [Bacilli bacterium]MEE3426704.1 CYTH domain-containing protein [Candidatus Enteromonas sp.]MBQ2052507.1 CYTH domain-containing protein [Bacilli bacterium]MCR5091230.1 CYTH domain-containing protein [Bacilli bacterium]MEE3431521.1 CYTH domain-containing protein [Candidatus Enteromonas sp.]